MYLLLSSIASILHRHQLPPSSDRPNLYPSLPTFSKTSFDSLFKSHICFALSSSSSSNYEREEARWLREEQRWLREEERWLRQESRWSDERESLLREIAVLKLKFEELERFNSVQGASASDIAAILRVWKEGELGKKLNQIGDSGSNAVPLVLETRKKEKEEEVIVKEVVKVTENEVKQGKKRVTLRKGSEGEEVRAMQDALLALGFYSGEEDMEFSTFSSGTERAVKTWQSTVGASEDGIMTAELLERLHLEQQSSGLQRNHDPEGMDLSAPQEGANGAAVAVTRISEVKQTVLNDKGITEVAASQHRVFLLGENRWEEPSRLTARNQQVGQTRSKNVTIQCPSCRGEGHLLCMECDGTGEPNIEPQFLEWVDEGTKCPYCEGRGYTICDVCRGKSE